MFNEKWVNSKKELRIRIRWFGGCKSRVTKYSPLSAFIFYLWWQTPLVLSLKMRRSILQEATERTSPAAFPTPGAVEQGALGSGSMGTPKWWQTTVVVQGTCDFSDLRLKLVENSKQIHFVQSCKDFFSRLRASRHHLRRKIHFQRAEMLSCPDNINFFGWMGPQFKGMTIPHKYQMCVGCRPIWSVLNLDCPKWTQPIFLLEQSIQHRAIRP